MSGRLNLKSTHKILLPVNQSLQTESSDDVPSAPDALVPDGGEESPSIAADPGAERGADEAAPVASGKGRVLLIEDDPGFNEVTRDYLVECGNTVVAVQSGAEGVREVLAGDFSLIFCDMAMPTMPGDMFYRAVERIRPQLCERFVFMTGYRDDARTSEFIKQVGAYVLRKPFPLKHLVDSIAFIEVLSSFQSVFEGPPTVSLASPVSPAGDPYLERVTRLRAAAAAVEDSETLPPAQADPLPRRPPTAPPAIARPPRAGGVSRAFAFAELVPFVVLAALLGTQYLGARERAAGAATVHLAFEAEWRGVAAHREEAEKVRRGLVSLHAEAKRIAEERTGSGWMGALRAVSTAASAEIDLRGVTARGVQGPPGACEILIDGVATGSIPRAIADEFYQALRRELDRTNRGAVSTRLEKLEDEPEPSSEPSGQRRAIFAITVKIGSHEPPQTGGEAVP